MPVCVAKHALGVCFPSPYALGYLNEIILQGQGIYFIAKRTLWNFGFTSCWCFQQDTIFTFFLEMVGHYLDGLFFWLSIGHAKLKRTAQLFLQGLMCYAPDRLPKLFREEKLVQIWVLQLFALLDLLHQVQEQGIWISSCFVGSPPEVL